MSWRYTDNRGAADQFEFRPYIGPKLFLPNKLQWNIYNYTRYEFRDIYDLDSHKWEGIHRLRSRFGLEIPLASRERAWKPKTFYAITDVEPFFRFDKDVVDPLRTRAGLAYVLNDHVRIEFTYTAEFTRPGAGSSSLDYTGNIFRLNIKFGLAKGILDRINHTEKKE